MRPDNQQNDGGEDRAARRLREFLERRLPPGAKPEDLNPEIAREREEARQKDPDDPGEPACNEPNDKGGGGEGPPR